MMTSDPLRLLSGGGALSGKELTPSCLTLANHPFPNTHTRVTVQLQRPGSPVLGPNLTGLGARLSLPVPVASPRHLETPACSGTI